MSYYNEFSPNCYEPLPSFGVALFCIIMVLILPGAFIVIIVVSFLLLFLPCLIYMIKKEMDQRR